MLSQSFQPYYLLVRELVPLLSEVILRSVLTALYRLSFGDLFVCVLTCAGYLNNYCFICFLSEVFQYYFPSSVSRIASSILFRISLRNMNSLPLFLYHREFLSPSIIVESFAGFSDLDGQMGLCRIQSLCFRLFWFSKFSLRIQCLTSWVAHCVWLVFFSLASFKTLSLFCIFSVFEPWYAVGFSFFWSCLLGVLCVSCVCTGLFLS